MCYLIEKPKANLFGTPMADRDKEDEYKVIYTGRIPVFSGTLQECEDFVNDFTAQVGVVNPTESGGG